MRIVTPGTLTDSDLLPEKSERPLLALCTASAQRRQRHRRPGLAVDGQRRVDADGIRRRCQTAGRRAAAGTGTHRTGRNAGAPTTGEHVPSAAARPRPRACRTGISTSAAAHKALLEQLGVATLAGFGADDLGAALGRGRRAAALCRSHAGQAACSTCAALAVESEQRIHRPGCRHPPQPGIDRNHARRGCVIASPTLFSLLDHCRTAMGSRLLRHWLHHARRDQRVARARHAAIAML